MFPFTFNAHQDVVKNLVYSMVVLLILAFEIIYWAVLPPQHRQGLRNLLRLDQTWLLQVSSISVLTVVSIILVYGFEIHLVYDKYFVGWRVKYDTTFILPEVCRPFEKKIDPRFMEVAKANRDEFMNELFYAYVRDRDPKVDQNRLVRFYERVTKYWITQLTEFVLYFLLVIAVCYMPIYRLIRIPCVNLGLTSLLLIVCMMANAWLARKSLGPVREITQEQIDSIHEHSSVDLDKRLARLSLRHGLGYK